MKPEKITAACIIATMFTLPAIASAFSLVNATDAPFTVSINNYCSSAFGNVPVHRETHVNDGVIMNLCGKNNDNCVGRIHELENCTGLEIGSFVFNNDAEVQGSPVTQAPGFSVKPIVYMNLVAIGKN